MEQMVRKVLVEQMEHKGQQAQQDKTAETENRVHKGQKVIMEMMESQDMLVLKAQLER